MNVEDAEEFSRKQFTGMLGTLLALTVIGQFATDAEKDGSTHPSVWQRFKQAVDISFSLCESKADAAKIFKDTLSFQRLLWRTQKKGLGKRWEKQKEYKEHRE